ncbi:MAG: acyltransferase, partial [Gemmatimonadetes bacterium]|nr:acyltransferase [Gemmatimonadota bacterium]
FFVLSGFLITWLLLKEREETGDVSLRGFYLRRTLRIFPAYYVMVALSCLNSYLRLDAWPTGQVVAALTYTVNYWNAFGGTAVGIGEAWSLAVEEQFYLLWPITFILLARRGPKAIAKGLVAATAVVVLWRSYLVLGVGMPPRYIFQAFDTRFDNLAVGCLLAVVLLSARAREWAAASARFVWLPLLTAAGVVVSRVGISDRYHGTVGLTVEAVLLAVLLVQLLLLQPRRLWSWLENPVVRYVGLISYPLYLYHVFVMHAAHRLAMLPMGVQLLVGVGGSVVLASGSYFLVEKPFLRLKKVLSERAKRREASALAPAMLPAVEG